MARKSPGRERANRRKIGNDIVCETRDVLPAAILEWPGALNSWYNIQVCIRTRVSNFGSRCGSDYHMPDSRPDACNNMFSSLRTSPDSWDRWISSSLGFRMRARERALDERNADETIRQTVKIERTGSNRKPAFVLGEDRGAEGSGLEPGPRSIP